MGLGDKRSMSRFKVYSPDQAYLLPPSVRDELGKEHLCFFVRGVIERLDMNVFEQSYSAYVPDSNMARALNLGTRCRTRALAPAHRPMRAKLRSPAGQAAYARRKAVVEPVFGVPKQQRRMRQFRTCGLKQVENEFTLATPTTSPGCTLCVRPEQKRLKIKTAQRHNKKLLTLSRGYFRP